MAADAIARQSKIVFGELPDNKTADFEPDEAQVFKWQESPDDASELRAYHYLVWVGAYQRGDSAKFALKERGVRTSHGEGRFLPWMRSSGLAFAEKSSMSEVIWFS